MHRRRVFDVEPFAVAAAPQLAAFPLHQAGVCANPFCSKHFAPTRPWQAYCSAACRKQDEQEMRWVGQKAAPALLAHRMGKYETDNEALRALGRAGRNYVSRLQSEWFASRRMRAQEAAERGQHG